MNLVTFRPSQLSVPPTPSHSAKLSWLDAGFSFKFTIQTWEWHWPSHETLCKQQYTMSFAFYIILANYSELDAKLTKGRISSEQNILLCLYCLLHKGLKMPKNNSNTLNSHMSWKGLHVLRLLLGPLLIGVRRSTVWLTNPVYYGFVFQTMQYSELLNCFVLNVFVAGSRLSMRSGSTNTHTIMQCSHKIQWKVMAWKCLRHQAESWPWWSVLIIYIVINLHVN